MRASPLSLLAAEPERAPPVFTPTSASGTPAARALPVTLPKPTTVWITKRIFVTKGPDLTVIIGSYGCGGPSCGVSTEGKAKYAGPPAGLTASARMATHPKHKLREVIVGNGKTTIPGGRSGPVKMKLTKAGLKLLGKQGSLRWPRHDHDPGAEEDHRTPPSDRRLEENQEEARRCLKTARKARPAETAPTE
jgi:hypothetical protein